MSIATVLTLIFIVLKLVGVIAWSWWLVMSPMIFAAILWLMVVLLVTLAKH